MPVVVTAKVVVTALDAEAAPDAGIVIESCVKLQELSIGIPVHCKWIVPANPLRDVTGDSRRAGCALNDGQCRWKTDGEIGRSLDYLRKSRRHRRRDNRCHRYTVL